jgi:DNA-binding NarL/FixJ family response regulator
VNINISDIVRDAVARALRDVADQLSQSESTGDMERGAPLRYGEKGRRALEMRDQGMRIRDIAKELNTTENSVQSSISRLRKAAKAGTP